jgi:preprotein translocase subunit SecF
MDTIEQQLSDIKKRNSRVELDKAWEMSWTRRITIAIITYVIALIWLMMIHEPSAAWKAFVPTAGYILSTMSLGFVKKFWTLRRT